MKEQNNVRITFRVNKEIKEQADILFKRLGINMSAAINIFLRKAVDESAIPFPVSVKNNAFGRGFSASDVTNAFAGAVQADIAEKKQKGLPVARYDAEKKQAYLENADGTREYLNG